MAAVTLTRVFSPMSVSVACRSLRYQQLATKHWQINCKRFEMLGSTANWRYFSCTPSMKNNGRKYTETHEWASLSGNTAVVGISDYAQDKLGDVVYVDLPEIGAEFSKEDVYGAVESVKAASDLYSPLSGKVTEVNEQLESEPELVNKEPYDKGWIMKMEVSNPSEFDNLLSEQEYEKFLEESQ